MVQATRTLSLLTHRERVNVFFDKSLQIPAVEKICGDSKEADSFIESQYALAIRRALIKFAKQQLYILDKYPAMRGAAAKINSAQMIIREMEATDNQRLIVVTSKVYWLRYDIYRLRPSEKSRYRNNYDTVIWPLVDLCFNHSKKTRMALAQTRPRYRQYWFTKNAATPLTKILDNRIRT